MLERPRLEEMGNAQPEGFQRLLKQLQAEAERQKGRKKRMHSRSIVRGGYCRQSNEKRHQHQHLTLLRKSQSPSSPKKMRRIIVYAVDLMALAFEVFHGL